MRLNALNECLLAENLEKKRPYLAARIEKYYRDARPFADGEDYTNRIETAINDFAAIDPVCVRSGGKKTPFVNQICTWVLTHKMLLPEDAETVRTMLEKYAKLSENQRKPLESYASPGQMRKDVEDADKDQGLRDVGYEDYANPVATEGDFTMYEINSFSMGQHCFKDSGWCVQQEQYFEEYGAPYYMVVRGKGRKEKRYALLHRNSYQIKDVTDEPLTLDLALPIA